MKGHESTAKHGVEAGSNTAGGKIATNPVPIWSRAHDVKDMRAQARLTPASESGTGEKRKWWWFRLSADRSVSRCAHCGSTSFGPGCSYARSGIHRHQTDERHCEYCGSTAYGRGCSYSPFGVHCHGGGNRCRWCGSMAGGLGCPYYPTGVHEQ